MVERRHGRIKAEDGLGAGLYMGGGPLNTHLDGDLPLRVPPPRSKAHPDPTPTLRERSRDRKEEEQATVACMIIPKLCTPLSFY